MEQFNQDNNIINSGLWKIHSGGKYGGGNIWGRSRGSGWKQGDQIGKPCNNADV